MKEIGKNQAKPARDGQGCKGAGLPSGRDPCREAGTSFWGGRPKPQKIELAGASRRSKDSGTPKRRENRPDRKEETSEGEGT